MSDLSAIFKEYDVRGIVPSQLDEPAARAIGLAFARWDSGAGGPGAAKPVVIGHDMRSSSPTLAAAFADGVRRAGRETLEIGLAATDEVYFASGSRDAPAAMITASHNPADNNGIKLCRTGAVALSRTTGLDEVRAEAEYVLDAGERQLPPATGRSETADLLAAYADHLVRLVRQPPAARRLRVVADAANGMAGLTAPAVLGRVAVDLVPMYFDLDGTFPNHEANPLVAENLRDLSARVVAEHADLGLAFDGDADRCFVVDETGTPVSPSVITSLIASAELRRHPGSIVLHNVVTSRAVPETIVAHGGIPRRTPVGHSLIKAEMARSGAIFAGEHSGHYYFRDFWCADSGLLAALHVIAAVAASAVPMAVLAAGLSPYAASGEISLAVADAPAAVDAVAAGYAACAGVTLDRLDGLSVIGEDWWLNVRPSNTEPLVRLNVEACDEQTMIRRRDSALALLRRQP